jgi:hypothetical protein
MKYVRKARSLNSPIALLLLSIGTQLREKRFTRPSNNPGWHDDEEQLQV